MATTDLVPPTARNLLMTAAVASGLLAGIDVDRAVVTMPAWQQVGPEAWGAFSRYADLGNGLFLYPVLAIGAALSAAAAAFEFWRHAVSRSILVPVLLAVVLAAAGLALTLMAAPVMLGIENVGDPEALRRAFADFRFWDGIRGPCQVLAFIALVWALGALSRRDS